MAYNYEYPYTDPSRYNDDWILKTVKDVLSQVSTYTEWREKHEREYLQLKALVDSMKVDIENIEKGNLTPAMIKALREWVEINLVGIVGGLVKFVFFGLTDDGYFCVYIPENWKDINFDTDVDPEHTDFGKLQIIY